MPTTDQDMDAMDQAARMRMIKFVESGLSPMGYKVSSATLLKIIRECEDASPAVRQIVATLLEDHFIKGQDKVDAFLLGHFMGQLHNSLANTLVGRDWRIISHSVRDMNKLPLVEGPDGPIS